MFGNNRKKETTNRANGTLNASSSHSLNSLVKGTVIEGSIKSESDIRIDGKIKGNLDCQAKVIIGPSGSIEGEVTCQNAVIEGSFTGTMMVKELLNIRETANVNGDISTNKLIIQSGAVFNAVCDMGAYKEKPVSKSNGAIKSVKQAQEVVKV